MPSHSLGKLANPYNLSPMSNGSETLIDLVWSLNFHPHQAITRPLLPRYQQSLSGEPRLLSPFGSNKTVPPFNHEAGSEGTPTKHDLNTIRIL